MCVGLTPDPDKATDADVAELLRVALPVADPVFEGVKLTLKETACPGFKTNGNDNPLIPNPGPLVLPLETVILEPPVFESCTCCVLELPTVTFPKLTDVGVTARAPAVAPVPLKDTVAVEVEVEILTLPVTLVAEAGENVTDS